MNPNSHIKLLFAAVILWQIPQNLIISKVGEPYPALVMAGFAGTLADADGNVRFSNVICTVSFQDGGHGGRSRCDRRRDLLAIRQSSATAAGVGSRWLDPVRGRRDCSECFSVTVSLRLVFTSAPLPDPVGRLAG
jgi:hypothetical protein